MEDRIFRKSSIDQISSPERLNEYKKITHPERERNMAICSAISPVLVNTWFRRLMFCLLYPFRYRTDRRFFI